MPSGVLNTPEIETEVEVLCFKQQREVLVSLYAFHRLSQHQQIITFEYNLNATNVGCESEPCVVFVLICYCVLSTQASL